jgi:hypothetical protein
MMGWRCCLLQNEEERLPSTRCWGFAASYSLLQPDGGHEWDSNFAVEVSHGTRWAGKSTAAKVLRNNEF